MTECVYSLKIHSNQCINYYQRKRKIRDKKLNPKSFIHCSQNIDDVYENLEDYNKKLSPIVTELFRRDRKLSISLVFISQCLKYLKL